MMIIVIINIVTTVNVGTTGNPKGVAVQKKRWLMDAKSNTFSGQTGKQLTILYWNSIRERIYKSDCIIEY